VSDKEQRAAARRTTGRLGDLGQDYDQGHLTYVEKLDPGGRLWLWTKPFAAPPNEELARCLRAFAHLVERLQLGPRAQVLDVGCGPGWLSEFLARCGYWVTGVDISPDMVEIARERVAAIPGQIGEGLEPLAEFHAMRVREMPWTSQFDAAVLYDTMHHFDNELETLEVIHRTLAPGGQLYIHEGVLPPKGSEAERNLVAEMERFGTLESPFDTEYLIEIVEKAGFTDIARLVEVDELVDLGQARAERGGVLSRIRVGRDRSGWHGTPRPEFNIIHAKTPVPAEQADAAAFSARLEARGEWQAGSSEFLVCVEVTNTGRAFWPAGLWYPFPTGSVTIGPYLPGPEGEREVELGRISLPHSLPPGQSAVVEIRVPNDHPALTRPLAVDVVREGVFWFAEVGSEPLTLAPAND
jgi:SAM-dependent methyltransferase